MKFVTLITLLLISLSSSSNLFRKVNTNPAPDNTCKLLDKKGNDIGTLEKNGQVFPGNIPTTDPNYAKMKKNAVDQMSASRSLLNTPGKANRDIIWKIAAILDNIDFTDKKLAELLSIKDFNRQASKDEKKQTTYFGSLLQQVKTIKEIYNSPKGSILDYAGLLSTVGDIGAVIGDYTDFFFEKNGKKKDDANQPERLKFIKLFMKGLKTHTNVSNTEEATEQELKDLFDVSNEVRDVLAGYRLAPNKSKERLNCSYKGKDDTGADIAKTRMEARYGIMGLGQEVDKTLGIPSVELNWPWQTVPTYLQAAYPTEPFAGHISGSIGESIFVLILSYWKSKKLPDQTKAQTIKGTFEQFNLYNKEVKDKFVSDTRKSICALSAAYLASGGYHTAAELMPTIKVVLGEVSKDLLKSKDAKTTFITIKDGSAEESNTLYPDFKALKEVVGPKTYIKDPTADFVQLLKDVTPKSKKRLLK